MSSEYYSIGHRVIHVVRQWLEADHPRQGEDRERLDVLERELTEMLTAFVDERIREAVGR